MHRYTLVKIKSDSAQSTLLVFWTDFFINVFGQLLNGVSSSKITKSESHGKIMDTDIIVGGLLLNESGMAAIETSFWFSAARFTINCGSERDIFGIESQSLPNILNCI